MKIIFTSCVGLFYILVLLCVIMVGILDTAQKWLFPLEGELSYFICRARTGPRANILQPKCASIIFDTLIYSINMFNAFSFAINGAKEENSVMLVFGFCFSNIFLAARSFFGAIEAENAYSLAVYSILTISTTIFVLVGLIGSLLLTKFVFSWRVFTLIGGKTHLSVPYRFYQFISTFAQLDRQMSLIIFFVGLNYISYREYLTFINFGAALVFTIVMSYILEEYGMVRNKWYWVAFFFLSGWFLPGYLVYKAINLVFGNDKKELTCIVDYPDEEVPALYFTLQMISVIGSGFLLVFERVVLLLSLIFVYPCLYGFKNMDDEVFAGLYDRRCEPSCTKYFSRKTKCSSVIPLFCKSFYSNLRNDLRICCCLLPPLLLIDTPTFLIFCTPRVFLRCLCGEYKYGYNFIDKTCVDSCDRAYPCNKFYGRVVRNKNLAKSTLPEGGETERKGKGVPIDNEKLLAQMDSTASKTGAEETKQGVANPLDVKLEISP